eukprot:1954142-Alexandrium_andersonii.AAC.1
MSGMYAIVATNSVRGRGMRAARLLVRPAVLRRWVPTPLRFASCVSRPGAVVRAQPCWTSL